MQFFSTLEDFNHQQIIASSFCLYFKQGVVFLPVVLIYITYLSRHHNSRYSFVKQLNIFNYYCFSLILLSFIFLRGYYFLRDVTHKQIILSEGRKAQQIC